MVAEHVRNTWQACSVSKSSWGPCGPGTRLPRSWRNPRDGSVCRKTRVRSRSCHVALERWYLPHALLNARILMLIDGWPPLRPTWYLSDLCVRTEDVFPRPSLPALWCLPVAGEQTIKIMGNNFTSCWRDSDGLLLTIYTPYFLIVSWNFLETVQFQPTFFFLLPEFFFFFWIIVSEYFRTPWKADRVLFF